MTQLITQPKNHQIQNDSQSQIHSDAQLIQLWLHTEGRRSERTRSEYLRDIQLFQEQSGKLLREIVLQDLIDYQDTLSDLATSTQARRCSSIKSLLSFAHKIGYLPVDVGKVVSTLPIENKLSERILSEEELFKILSLETNPRNLLLLKVFYVSAGRVSETVSLQWRNLQPNGAGGQITFFGKGGKTRAVLIPENLWNDLQFLRTEINHKFINQPKVEDKEERNSHNGNPDQNENDNVFRQQYAADENRPVFTSQKGSQLSVSQAWRIVRAATLRTGIGKNVSPHWFRHAHISHALDNGAPIHLVSETAGHSSIAVTSRYSHARPNESSSSYLKIK